MFYMPQICDMGPTALLPLWREACWGFFRPKNPTASTGCKPANLGTEVSTLPLDHRSREIRDKAEDYYVCHMFSLHTQFLWHGSGWFQIAITAWITLFQWVPIIVQLVTITTYGCQTLHLLIFFISYLFLKRYRKLKKKKYLNTLRTGDADLRF